MKTYDGTSSVLIDLGVNVIMYTKNGDRLMSIYSNGNVIISFSKIHKVYFNLDNKNKEPLIIINNEIKNYIEHNLNIKVKTIDHVLRL